LKITESLNLLIMPTLVKMENVKLATERDIKSHNTEMLPKEVNPIYWVPWTKDQQVLPSTPQDYGSNSIIQEFSIAHVQPVLITVS
jgi:hypothetical protein